MMKNVAKLLLRPTGTGIGRNAVCCLTILGGGGSKFVSSKVRCVLLPTKGSPGQGVLLDNRKKQSRQAARSLMLLSSYLHCRPMMANIGPARGPAGNNRQENAIARGGALQGLFLPLKSDLPSGPWSQACLPEHLKAD